MYSFVSVALPATCQNKSPWCLNAPLAKPGNVVLSKSATPKRWRMTLNNRSAEFSMDDSSEPDGTTAQNTSQESDVVVDWDDWVLSGKPMEIPAVPFPPAQVFMPGELKQLHLFEARYLALFEAVVVNYDKKCAHVLIDSSRHAMAAFGTVVYIKSWRRLDIGVSVELEGIGRFKAAKLKSSSPFLRGEFESVDDVALATQEEVDEAKRLETLFWKSFRKVISLSVKLNENPLRTKIDTSSQTINALDQDETAPKKSNTTISDDNQVFRLSPEAKIELFEQKVKQSATRAVNHTKLDFSTKDVSDEILTKRVQGLSFAGWDFFPSQPGDRQKAIEQRDTLKRFKNVVERLEQFSLKLAAKLALQDVFSA